MTGLILPKSYVERQTLSAAMAAKHKIEGRAKELLKKHYPGHPFTVSYNMNDQSLRVDHQLLSKHGACMYIHPEDVQKEGHKALIRVCGEMLERVKIERKALESFEQYAKAQPLAKEEFDARR